MKNLALFLICTLLTACGGGRDLQVPGLVAEKKGTIHGPGGCGVDDAFLVTEAAGVRLSQPALLTEEAARALNAWVANRAIPAIGRKGGGLVELRVASHYACRSRNSRPGARLSEHARGRAIDISAFVMADGSRLVVEDDWSGDDGRLLRRLHASACGPFGTVLGPEADAHHRDHFHFDVADYRSGAYCQ